ncbi:hypothetical protein CDD83_9541 [Cordyceps sp. RAO-2017]|nr:hypothetical protein CDD83_9541 [Cordyceps sp. RAO-2017]
MLFGSPGAIAGVLQPAAAGETIQALGKLYPEGKIEAPPAKRMTPEGRELTPNPDCRAPCGPPGNNPRETTTFEYITSEGTGYGCQVRFDGMTTFEFPPSCCSFKELKRERVKYGNRCVRSTIKQNQKRSRGYYEGGDTNSREGPHSGEAGSEPVEDGKSG